MDEVALKIAVPLIGGVVAFLLFALLLFRRIDRRMPVFVAYIGYYVVEGLVSAAVDHYIPRDYPAVYLALINIDFLFSMVVLFEIGRNVLCSNRILTSGWMRWPAFLFGGCGLLLWSVVRWSKLPYLIPTLLRIDLRSWQASTILTTAAIFAILVWSNALKLRWPERELRVLTGMGIVALIAFVVLVAYTDGDFGHRYYWLDLVEPIVCTSIFLYWLSYFLLDASAIASIGSEQTTELIVSVKTPVDTSEPPSSTRHQAADHVAAQPGTVNV
jgi:hypothetical protein